MSTRSGRGLWKHPDRLCCRKSGNAGRSKKARSTNRKSDGLEDRRSSPHHADGAFTRPLAGPSLACCRHSPTCWLRPYGRTAGCPQPHPQTTVGVWDRQLGTPPHQTWTRQPHDTGAQARQILDGNSMPPAAHVVQPRHSVRLACLGLAFVSRGHSTRSAPHCRMPPALRPRTHVNVCCYLIYSILI